MRIGSRYSSLLQSNIKPFQISSSKALFSTSFYAFSKTTSVTVSWLYGAACIRIPTTDHRWQLSVSFFNSTLWTLGTIEASLKAEFSTVANASISTRRAPQLNGMRGCTSWIFDISPNKKILLGGVKHKNALTWLYIYGKARYSNTIAFTGTMNAKDSFL